jgi:hypothetical protein
MGDGRAILDVARSASATERLTTSALDIFQSAAKRRIEFSVTASSAKVVRIVIVAIPSDYTITRLRSILPLLSLARRYWFPNKITDHDFSLQYPSRQPLSQTARQTTKQRRICLAAEQSCLV